MESTTPDIVPIHLPRQHWNAIIAILAEHPWKTVNPLIHGIGVGLDAHDGGRGPRARNGAMGAEGPPYRGEGAGDLASA